MTIFILEEHNQAWPIWEAYGGAGKPLILFDRHLDMDYIPARRLRKLEKRLQESMQAEVTGIRAGKLVNITNFLFPAILSLHLPHIYWIKDAMAAHSSIERARDLYRLLSRMERVKFASLDQTTLSAWGDLESRAYNIRLTLGTAKSLDQAIPELAHQAPIWDIDMDFFYTEKGKLRPEHLELILAAIRAANAKPPLVTISLSQRSGFAPRSVRRYIDTVLSAIMQQAGNDPVIWIGANGCQSNRPDRVSKSAWSAEDSCSYIHQILCRCLASERVQKNRNCRYLGRLEEQSP